MPVYRSLSPEGEKEIGHIFKEGVPVQTYTPIWAKLRGQLELVFYVDWNSLGENQKFAGVRIPEPRNSMRLKRSFARILRLIHTSLSLRNGL